MDQLKKRIGVDVDGILANFCQGFAKLLIRLTGKKLVAPDTIEPTSWDWPEAVGYSTGEVVAAWKVIETDPVFWASLLPMANVAEFLTALERSGHDVYFVTARPGLTAKRQTEFWLKRYVNLPTVLIAEAKGLAVQLLRLDVYIDDRLQNCDVATIAGARTYMLTTGYNQENHDPAIVQVKSILEMLDHEGIPYELKEKACA